MPRISRDENFIEIAKIVAKRSPCLSRQVGAVIVNNNRIISTGYNGPPAGHVHCSECLRKISGADLDTCPAIHAEMNALSFKYAIGAVVGGTIYCTDEPCINCTKLIIANGIIRIVYLKPYPLNDNGKKLIEDNNIIKERYAYK